MGEPTVWTISIGVRGTQGLRKVRTLTISRLLARESQFQYCRG